MVEGMTLPDTVIMLLHSTRVFMVPDNVRPGIVLKVKLLRFAPGLQYVNVYKKPPGIQKFPPLTAIGSQSILQSCGLGTAPSIKILTPTASGCNKILKETQRSPPPDAPQHNPSLSTSVKVSEAVGLAERSTGRKGTCVWQGPQPSVLDTVIVCTQVD